MAAGWRVSAAPDPETLAWLPLNDSGNAERLAARSGGLLRWVDLGEGAGYWIGFDGQRWHRKAGEMAARRLAQAVPPAMREEARALAEAVKAGRMPDWCTPEVAEERIKNLHQWCVKSGDKGRTDGMLAQARVMLAADEDEFDRDRLALNVRNGTLRFVQGAGGVASSGLASSSRAVGQTAQGWHVRLDPHDPADMITRMAEVDYDPGAECPTWLARLAHLQPEPDQREMMRRIHGYALLGIRSEQKFILAQGRGGDGKTLSYAVIAAIMGDYYRHADVQSFLKGGTKSGSDHSEDLARLAGDTRLVTCDEPERFATFNSKIIKQATGGGRMTVRALRQASVEVEVRWLLVMECNPLPKVPTSDDGFWRRCVPFQWPVQLRPAEQAAQPYDVLFGALMAEASGILNWAIGGALDWLTERDLKPSARSAEVKEAYRNSSDPFGEWYRTRCATGAAEAMRELTADLHENFKAFCTEELGIDAAKVPGIRAFGSQLDERQHMSRKSGGVMYRLGIRLLGASERDGGGAAGSDGGAGDAGGFGTADWG